MMEFHSLTVQDKEVFERGLGGCPHSLSAYSFAQNFIWRPLFELRWTMIRDNFCLFFSNDTGCFMNQPPLGDSSPEVIHACFQVMQELNHNPDLSRIENVEEDKLEFFKRNNFRVYEKGSEYVLDRAAVASLRGEKYKHKRSLYNYFRKNYDALFRDYRDEDKAEVLELYRRWQSGRACGNGDPLYQAMLEDSRKAFGQMLDDFGGLGLIAKVVLCAGSIQAFSSGFYLDRALFCVNFEIADLKFKGLAQFIFSEFAKTLAPAAEINIMDTLGLENLRQVKLSYRPERRVPSWTVLMNQ